MNKPQPNILQYLSNQKQSFPMILTVLIDFQGKKKSFGTKLYPGISEQ